MVVRGKFGFNGASRFSSKKELKVRFRKEFKKCQTWELVQERVNSSVSNLPIQGAVVGVKRTLLPGLVLESSDFSVQPVLDVVQHALIIRTSGELPGFPGPVPLNH
ncbi:hypothetical protein TNIN_454891 [Trichonephila inaurata madagascariensis]|uniref:Uncharacterized protein n=1 Tax=Trichonephila inaurata madagascariensis TaxID=2747483 RepID=A0A8X7BM16_9ARAC|nr:hypothetical protein TNIN_454891 [Trichonephila inaurata madagascariensis]